MSFTIIYHQQQNLLLLTPADCLELSVPNDSQLIFWDNLSTSQQHLAQKNAGLQLECVRLNYQNETALGIKLMYKATPTALNNINLSSPLPAHSEELTAFLLEKTWQLFLPYLRNENLKLVALDEPCALSWLNTPDIHPFLSRYSTQIRQLYKVHQHKANSWETVTNTIPWGTIALATSLIALPLFFFLPFTLLLSLVGLTQVDDKQQKRRCLGGVIISLLGAITVTLIIISLL